MGRRSGRDTGRPGRRASGRRAARVQAARPVSVRTPSQAFCLRQAYADMHGKPFPGPREWHLPQAVIDALFAHPGRSPPNTAARAVLGLSEFELLALSDQTACGRPVDGGLWVASARRHGPICDACAVQFLAAAGKVGGRRA